MSHIKMQQEEGTPLILLLVSWALLESQLQSCWGIHQNKSPEITKIR